MILARDDDDLVLTMRGLSDVANLSIFLEMALEHCEGSTQPSAKAMAERIAILLDKLAASYPEMADEELFLLETRKPFELITDIPDPALVN